MRQFEAAIKELGAPALAQLPSDLFPLVLSNLDSASLCYSYEVSSRFREELIRALPLIIFELPVSQTVAVINSGHGIGTLIKEQIMNAAPEKIAKLFLTATDVEKVALIFSLTNAFLDEDSIQVMLYQQRNVLNPVNIAPSFPATLINPEAIYLSTQSELRVYYETLVCHVYNILIHGSLVDQKIVQELIVLNPAISHIYFSIFRYDVERNNFISYGRLNTIAAPVVDKIVSNAKSNYYLARKLISLSDESKHFIKLCAFAEKFFQYKSTYESVRKELIAHYPSYQMAQCQSTGIEQEAFDFVFQTRNLYAQYDYMPKAMEHHLLRFFSLFILTCVMTPYIFSYLGVNFTSSVVRLPVLYWLAPSYLTVIPISTLYLSRKTQLLVQRAHYNRSKISLSNRLNTSLFSRHDYVRINSGNESSEMEEGRSSSRRSSALDVS